MIFEARAQNRRIGFRPALVILLSIFAFPISVRAEHVQALLKDGIVEIDGTKQIRMAGLEIPPESIRLISALVTGKEIEVKYDKSSASELPAAYIYMDVGMLRLPDAAGKKPERRRIMLNEFLLGIGAAKVSGTKFKYKDQFLTQEAEAKRRGDGIWSYDPSFANKVAKEKEAV